MDAGVESTGARALDLDRYLERIRCARPLGPDLATLGELHRRHLASIPFENVDVLLERPIRLDPESLQDKLVGRRRGGYCFEQNSLFCAVLRAIGFDVATLEARVRPPGVDVPLPRTHMVLRVAVEGREWLADVGFGGDGPTAPVPFDGEPSEEGEGAYRLVGEPNGIRALKRRWRGEWTDLYAFGPTPALPVDFEVANHFTATHPRSIFRRALTVQRSGPDARRILRRRTYTMRRGEEESAREVAAGKLGELLAREFGLELAEDDVAALERLALADGRTV